MNLFKKFFAILLLSSCLFSCENVIPLLPTLPIAQKKEVKMGVIIPLEKFATKSSECEIAADYLNGLALAVDLINKRESDVKISFLIADANENELQQQFEVMKKSGVNIFNIGLSNFVAKNLNYLERQNQESILINYFCEYAPAVVRSKNSIRFCPNTATICEKMASIIPETKDKSDSILILNSNDFMGKSAAAYMKYQTGSSGYNILNVEYKIGDDRFMLFAEQAKAIAPKFVIFYGWKESVEPLLNALLTHKYEGTVILNSEVDESLKSKFADLKIHYIKNSLSKNSQNASFADAYKKAYKKKPNYAASCAFDSVNIIFDAYVKSNFNANKARKSLINKSHNLNFCNTFIDRFGDSICELKLESLNN